MPPKKIDKKIDKADKKKQDKIIEDRTFGLKNKNKSKKVQSFIKGVAQSVKGQGQKLEQVAADQYEKQKTQKKLEEEKKLLASLFKTVNTIKKADETEAGELQIKICEFYKLGLCNKGKKCKFSHDLQRIQNQQINLYVDQRNQLYEENETMENWDENKLKEVVKANEQKYTKQQPTQIICKFFLDAIEKKKYGWNWVCPNGMICHYQHCLPPGFVLRSSLNETALLEELLEDTIERERAKLEGQNGPLLTKEQFLAWKEERKKKKEVESQKQKDDQEKKVKMQGIKGYHGLTGRALFTYDPSLFKDDQNAVDEKEYEVEANNEIFDNEDEEQQQKLYDENNQNDDEEEKKNENNTNKMEEIKEEEEEEKKIDEIKEPTQRENKKQKMEEPQIQKQKEEQNNQEQQQQIEKKEVEDNWENILDDNSQEKIIKINEDAFAE